MTLGDSSRKEDVITITDDVADHPPELIFGCARSALRPLLTCLRLVGLYFDSGHYDEWLAKRNQEKICCSSEEMERCHFRVLTDSEWTSLDSNWTLRRQIPSDAKIRRYSTTHLSEFELGVSDTTNRPVASTSTHGSRANGKYQSYNHKRCRDGFLYRCEMLDRQPPNETIAAEMNLPKECRGKQKTNAPYFWRKICDKIYPTFVLVVLWGNVLRCFFLYTNGEVHVMIILTTSMWFVVATVTATVVYVSCLRRDHFSAFFKKWLLVHQDPVSRLLGLTSLPNTKVNKLAVVAMCAVFTMNTGFVAFIMVADDTFSAGMNKVFYVTGHRSPGTIVLSSVVNAFTTFAWIGTISLLVVFSHYVSSHFWRLSQTMRYCISASKDSFPEHLQLFREHHLALCDAISILDRYFRLSVGCFYGISITLECCILYQVINVPLDWSVMTISVTWLTYGLFLIALVTYFVGNVNTSMLSVGRDLMTIQTRNITLDQLGQLQMFISKVNDPSLGFSIFGLTVVNREFMLTLFSVYITYCFVLFQFK